MGGSVWGLWGCEEGGGRTDVGVDVVDAGELVLDQDLAVLELRDGLGFGVLQFRGVASLREDDGSHGGGDGGRHLCGLAEWTSLRAQA
jgi:hypothetical protein